MIAFKFHIRFNIRIDIFGRHFKRSGNLNCGPPRIKFKAILEGDFDLEKKRLCNMSEAQEQSDAVNLNLLQRMVQQEILTV